MTYFEQDIDASMANPTKVFPIPEANPCCETETDPPADLPARVHLSTSASTLNHLTTKLKQTKHTSLSH